MKRATPRWVLVLAMLVAARTAGAAFPVGTTTRTLVTTSVTGTPRTLDTIVWYPAVPRTGTPETLGLRDAKVRRGRFPLVVFMHGTCGRPDEATYLTKALASQGFVVAAPTSQYASDEAGISKATCRVSPGSRCTRAKPFRSCTARSTAEWG